MAVVLSAATDTQVFGPGPGDIVLAAPGGLSSGDLRIDLAWQVLGGLAPDIGAGMTNIGSAYAIDSGIRAAWKIAGGSEGAITHATPGSELVSFGVSFRATGHHASTPKIGRAHV